MMAYPKDHANSLHCESKVQKLPVKFGFLVSQLFQSLSTFSLPLHVCQFAYPSCSNFKTRSYLVTKVVVA